MMTFKDGKPSHQMLTTNADYLSFGYGRHAWYVSVQLYTASG
jgi:hypothetical protein